MEYVVLNLGDLDGFSIETDAEFLSRQKATKLANLQFDPNTLKDDAAIRAVWILIYRRRWLELAILGLDRESLEPKLSGVSHYPEQLSKKQLIWLKRKIPEVVKASLVLRLMYIEKQFGIAVDF